MKVDAPVDARYTAQDWEGFKELVAASNLQDKDPRTESYLYVPGSRNKRKRNQEYLCCLL